MRANAIHAAAAIGLTCVPSIFEHKVSGSVLSSFSLLQRLEFDTSSYPQTTGTTSISDGTLPFQTTAYLNSGNGGVVSSTISAYDNGATAGLSIISSAMTSEPGTYLAELGNMYPDTTLGFTEPVDYSLSIQLFGLTGVDAGINVIGAPANLKNDNLQLSPDYEVSGVLQPNSYIFIDTWDLSNETLGSQYTDLSATESISFTFTPVPEPSSAVLPPALAVAARRRSRFRRVL